MRETLIRFSLSGVSTVGAMLLACSVAFAQYGQPQQGQDKQQPQPTGTSGMRTVTAGDIAANPESYYGQKVSVRAEVEDVLGRQAFLLDEDRLFAWPDVLVIAPTLTGMVPEDEEVTVTGTLRRFVDADLRREYDWNWWGDVDPDVFGTFRDRAVLVADSIRTDAGTELVRDAAQKRK